MILTKKWVRVMSDISYESLFEYKSPISDNHSGVLTKINNFSAFEPNWSYGVEGKAFSQDTIDYANKIYKCAINNTIYALDAFPGLDGEIMVTLYYKKYYMEFLLKDNIILECLYEEDGEEIFYEENIDFDQAAKNISKMLEEKQHCSNTYESSTQHIGTQDLADSKVSPSGTIMEAFRSLKENVQKQNLQEFASTLDPTTYQQQAIPYYSG